MSVTDQGSQTLTGSDLDALDAWWRAANYLSVGQIYLLGNPLLTGPLRPEHVKPRLLGHWGTTPGLNMIYVHLNRVIRNQDLNVIYVTGPGHGGPGVVANTYLEGTYSELYPHITQDAAGMGRLFKQFSFPGGIPSHAAPETPGSIHEGGELGYSLVHQVPLNAARTNPKHLAQLEAWMRSYRAEELFDGAGALVPELAGSRQYVNVIVAGKQPQWQWLSMDEAIIHCTRGAGIWEWASNDAPAAPDVVMACCGDTPTLETLAAVSLLRSHLPGLKVRVVNVVDLMRLEPESEHPHGMSDPEFDALFTVDRPVIFAYHGYPTLIHRLTYRRNGHANFHVRGYKEEGTTTTPFNMVMLNDLDRFHLVMDVIDRVPGLASTAGHVRQMMVDKRLSCRAYTRQEGQDAPEINDWRWPY